MLKLYEVIRRVAPRFRTALVTGSTGSGKELVARTLHELGGAASGPFVACNCSAIVETLFESELFGHTKGAFTNAYSDKAGFFERAEGGTLLLDEIGDMPMNTQVKLLRVLQDRQVQRVGSTFSRSVDVRVIAATNRNLRSQVELKHFREDLYYRLSMVEIAVPALTERMEDLPLLIHYLLEQFAGLYHIPLPRLSQQARRVLARHSWPGNVRELENVLGSACMLADTGVIDVDTLPDYLMIDNCSDASLRPFFACSKVVSLEELDLRYAQAVLAQVGDNKATAARLLGISRPRLYRLLNGRGDRPTAVSPPAASPASA